MIEAKTLLIVGAGASVPYGYPTGKELRDELCNPAKLRGLSDHYKIHERGIELFCQHFKASGLTSIDAFLAKRGDDEIGKQHSGFCNTFGTYANCGKLAIANRLIERENKNLFEPEKDHWLEYLWKHINDAPKTEFKDNQLKIISFNYDRVIEQYFQTVIQHTYTNSICSKETTELRKSIEIVHVYGDLQDLDERPYGEKSDDIKKVADCIKVIPEAREANDKQFNRAKEMITWAEKICFIGFGFDSTNLHRLGFPDHDLSGKEVYSTQYKMTFMEVFAAKKSLGNGINNFKHYRVEQTELETLNYIRETGFFLSL